MEAISIGYTLSGRVLDSKLLQEDLVCTIATDHSIATDHTNRTISCRHFCSIDLASIVIRVCITARRICSYMSFTYYYQRHPFIQRSVFQNTRPERTPFLLDYIFFAFFSALASNFACFFSSFLRAFSFNELSFSMTSLAASSASSIFRFFFPS